MKIRNYLSLMLLAITMQMQVSGQDQPAITVDQIKPFNEVYGVLQTENNKPFRIDTIQVGDTLLSSVDGKYIVEERANPSSIYCSNDFGASFIARDIPHYPQGIDQSYDGRYIIAYSEVSGIRVSRDYGLTWTGYGGATGSTAFVSMSLTGEYMYAYAWGTNELSYSSDYGATWGTTALVILPVISGLGFDVHGSGQYIIVTGSGQPVKYSSNYGASFSNVGGSLQWRDVAFSDSSYVYMAGSSDGIYRSINYGASFNLVEGTAGPFNYAIDCSTSGKYSVCAGRTEILVSNDFGATYTIEMTRPTANPTDVTINAEGNRMIAVYSDSIYRSNDFGASWVAEENINGTKFISMNQNNSNNARYPFYLTRDVNSEYNINVNGADALSVDQSGNVSFLRGGVVNEVSDDADMVDGSSTTLMTERAIKEAIANAAPPSGGEANTASNINSAGIGVFNQKSGVNLEFRGIAAGSNRQNVLYNGTTKAIEVDINEGNLDVSNMGGNLPVTSLNSGTGASATTFWRGDGVWAVPDVGDPMIYPSAGIAVSTGSAWGTSITDNSTNWNTAYTDRNKWDGGATGLIPSTGRTSLELGSMAIMDFWTGTQVEYNANTSKNGVLPQATNTVAFVIN